MRLEVAHVVQGEGRRKESRAGHASALIGGQPLKLGDIRPMNEGAMLLTVTEVAGRLGVSRRTVFELLKAGELPRIKVGAATRVAARDLEAYVDGQRSAPAREPEAISPGQLRALHAIADRLDKRRQCGRGETKRAALAEASRRFGRAIVSAAKLSSLEASEVLDWLEEQDQRTDD